MAASQNLLALLNIVELCSSVFFLSLSFSVFIWGRPPLGTFSQLKAKLRLSTLSSGWTQSVICEKQSECW